MSTPTPFEIELGILVRAKLGEYTKVVRFADDDKVNDIYIVSGKNCPIMGVNSYASVGLSRRTQDIEGNSVKVEILTACAEATPSIDNLVASCVLDSIKNGSNIIYGSTIKNVLIQYQISTTLKHVTFVAPFLWQGMDSLLVEKETVYYLMMIAISDAEKLHLEEHGIDSLEQIFNEKQIDLYNINRPCVFQR